MSPVQRSRTRAGLLLFGAALGVAAASLPADALAAGAPSITGLSTTIGSNFGFGPITVSGNGFTGATQVLLGSTAAQNFTVVDDHTITASFGQGSPGVLAVRVVAGGQTSPDTSLDQVDVQFGPPKYQTGLVPVTCTLGGTAGATFAANLATNFEGRNKTLTAGTDGGLGRFFADLYVPDSRPITDNPLGQPVGNATVTSLDAAVTGATATSIDLAGTPSSGRLSFPVATSQGSNPLAFRVAGFDQPSLVPTGKEAAVQVSFRGYHATVTLDGKGTPLDTTLDCLPSGGGLLVGSFAVTQPVPVVTSLSSTSGPTTGGTVLQITGSNLTNTSGVFFGQTSSGSVPSAKYTVVSDSRIDVTTPAHLPGTVPVSVVNSGGAAVAAPQFTFVGAAASAPVTITQTPTCTLASETLSNSFTLSPRIAITGSAPASVKVGEPAGLTAVKAQLVFSSADLDAIRQEGSSVGFGGRLAASISGSDQGTATTRAIRSSVGSSSGLVDLTKIPAGSGLTVDQTFEDLSFGTAAAGGPVVGSAFTFSGDGSIGIGDTIPGTNPFTITCAPGAGSVTIPVTTEPTQPTNVQLALKGSATLKTLAKGTVPLTGSLTGGFTGGAFAGDLTLAPATAKLVALGFLPVTAQLVFVPVAQTTGTLTGSALTTTSKLRLKLPSVSVFGIQLAGGTNCQTQQPTSLMLTSGSFTAAGGGLLAGTFAIGNLSGCGNLSGIVSSLTAGGGNAIALGASAPGR